MGRVQLLVSVESILVSTGTPREQGKKITTNVPKKQEMLRLRPFPQSYNDWWSNDTKLRNSNVKAPPSPSPAFYLQNHGLDHTPPEVRVAHEERSPELASTHVLHVRHVVRFRRCLGRQQLLHHRPLTLKHFGHRKFSIKICTYNTSGSFCYVPVCKLFMETKIGYFSSFFFLSSFLLLFFFFNFLFLLFFLLFFQVTILSTYVKEVLSSPKHANCFLPQRVGVHNEVLTEDKEACSHGGHTRGRGWYGGCE